MTFILPLPIGQNFPFSFNGQMLYYRREPGQRVRAYHLGSVDEIEVTPEMAEAIRTDWEKQKEKKTS